WNSVLEEIGSERFTSKLHKTQAKYNPPVPITQVPSVDTNRISLGFSEIDLVFGGGIVQGSLILLAGEPGVGKSTLILELSKRLSQSKKILYISGEESASQIRLRAERISAISEKILISSEVLAENIADIIYHEKPHIVFIDSIQTISRTSLQGIAGTLTQLRESTQFFLEVAKSTSIPIFLVGHITKEGAIAGPKVLEHIVDVVLYFESDKFNLYRILRTTKNRFGAVGNVAILEMHANGLSEVKDRDKVFITKGQEERIGSVISAVIEGTRAICVEIQALVTRT
ncbi:MAG: AAA family ATPase, partial [Leptospiraceae bacterium]|nr:AAA family ATPase [Leptospiraceae bacterium]